MNTEPRLNTKINYLYRDAGNYKVYNSCILSGVITDEQKARIFASLDCGEYFIPSRVGLPEKRFDTHNPLNDHPFFELDPENPDCFEETVDPATVDITVDALVASFEANADSWWEGLF